MADVRDDEQNAISKFSEEILNAFPAAAAKTEAGLQVCKDIVEFYRARAKLEDEYAKKLATLCKTPPGAGFFTKEPAITKEYKTLKESLMAILEKEVKISDAHQDFANKINNEICKSLDNLVKNKTNERTKILGEGQKHLKNVADAKAAVKRNKEEYEKLMKAADLAKEQLLKAEKDEVNQPENKKLPPITKKAQQTFVQAKDKAKAQETAYQNAVKKVNEEIETARNERMPTVFDSIQKWEEERWNTLLQSMRTFRSLQEVVPNVLDQQVKDLASVYANASIEDDFREFIEANKKGAEPEESFEFVPYKSKFENEEKKEAPKETVSEAPSTFSTQTAEEKLEKKSEEQKKKEREEQEAKRAADIKKAKDIKASLFGESNEDEDMFK